MHIINERKHVVANGGVVSDVRYYDSYPIYAERPMRMPSAEESTVIQTSPTGLPTVEISSVLKDGMPAGYLATRHYYDQYDREINTEQETPDGTVRIKRELTPGGLERKVTTAFGSVSMTERTGRDGFGRPMSTDVTLNDASNFTTGIYNYDDAGRLASVWSEGGVTTTFGYDTRGAVTSRTDRFIRQRYGYASGPGTPSYAGRLSLKALECNTGGDWKAREYLYGYDRLGRVVAVDGSDDRNSGDDCSEVFTYDLNANILSISRKGRTGTSGYSEVDDIVMQYSGNMLSGVTDRAEDVTLESSMDIPCGSFGGNDIRHDAAGCVTRDLSRGIADISYHAPGIPACIVTIGGDSIVYDYTSTGVKLGETVWNGSRITRRGYAGPVETVDGRVVRVNVAQGYFDSLGVLHAYIPDIQGNIVGVYEAKEGVTELEQLNEYYAYGGITADSRGQDRNRRKYTAKELITDLGLNSYDFSARWQYPALGRFDSPDSKAADYKWLSPYAFCGGDPINFSDPTGMRIFANPLGGNTHEWKEVDGKWGFYDLENNIYNGDDSFMNDLTNSLNSIMSCDEGNRLVTNLVGNDNALLILYAVQSGWNSTNNTVQWNNTDSNGDVPVLGNRMDCNPTINLAHELAHTEYSWSGGSDKTWFKEATGKKGDIPKIKHIKINEIYTTHIENLIRAQLNQPLRTYYSVKDNKGHRGKVLDANTMTSLYFDYSSKMHTKEIKKIENRFKFPIPKK